jgi:hypothetical protein
MEKPGFGNLPVVATHFELVRDGKIKLFGDASWFVVAVTHPTIIQKILPPDGGEKN